jgi:4-hydroxybenzoyl-CoA thioesterase/acyl-CoA thioester hydrolase
MFQATRRVEFAETDMAGIVHFANFFRYMEEAEHAFLRACGLSVMLDWEGERLTFPRVAAACDFVAPARFEDVLDITVRVERIGAKSATYAIGFTLEGRPVARGKLTTVCCRHRPGQPLESVPIPEGVRARLLERGA